MQITRLEGQRFGRLLVLEPAPSDKFGKARWKCRCDCGTECLKSSRPLLSGDSKSCGCLKRELDRTPKKHGRSKTKLYRVWSTMKSRCNVPADKAYKHYGARGIVVCDRWADSFDNFLADMGECPSGLTLDRKDNDGPYSPENCKWSTPIQQARNTRKNLRVTFRGKSLTLGEWAEETGIAESALYYRLREAGWSIERTLTTPSTPPVGEAHPGVKLSNADVAAIRAAGTTVRQSILAAKYGVSQSHIARLLNQTQRKQG